jgi:protein O-GlcNAc transferase
MWVDPGPSRSEFWRAASGVNLPVQVMLAQSKQTVRARGILDRSPRMLVVLLLVLLTPVSRGFAHDPLWRAGGLISSNHLLEAEQLLRHALAKQPNSAKLHAELGNLLLSEKKYSDAVEEIGQAAQLEPDNAEYTIRLADTLVAWGHYHVARDLLKSVNGKFASLPEYHHTLGMTYFALKDFDRATAEFERAVSRAPNTDSAYFLLGNSYAAKGDFKRAASALRKALTLNPRRADYYVALGKVLSEIPDHASEAAGFYQKALAVRPGYVPAQYYLAVAYTRRADLKQAQTLLENITERHPEALKAHILLARVYARLGRREDAKRETTVVRQLSPPAQLQTPSTGHAATCETPPNE